MYFTYRWSWVFLLLLYPFLSFYASPLESGVGHDKLKYLSIAWDMYQHGCSIVSFLNGEVYVSKPPLLFWLIAIFWHIFGVNLFAVQLLIDLCFIAWGLLLQAMYVIIFPRDQAGKNIIPYLLLGSYIILRDVNFLRVDLFLVIGVLLSNYGILKLIANKNKGAFLSIMIGTSLGLFSKGPIIFVFTFLPFLLSASFVHAYRRHIFQVTIATLIGAGIFIFFWFLPILLYEKNIFITHLVDEQSNSRMIYRHQSSYVYLFDYLPILLLPWIINIVFLKRCFRITKQFTDFNPFVFSVIIMGTLVLSLYWQKTVWYILPVCLMCLLYITRFFIVHQYENKVLQWNKYFLFSVYYLLGMGFVIFAFFPSLQSVLFRNFPLANYFSISQLLFITVIMVVAIICGYQQRNHLLRLIYVFSCTLFLIAGIIKTQAAIIQEKFTHLALVAQYLHHQEAYQEGVVAYNNHGGYFNFSARLSHSIHQLNTAEQLKAWLKRHPLGIVVVSGSVCPLTMNMHILVIYQETLKEAPLSLCQQYI